MGIRATIGIADQTASAASNLLLMVAVARVETAYSYGTFAFSIMIYSATLTVARALLAEPYTVVSNTEGQRVTRATCVGLLGVAIALGIAVALTGHLAFILLGVSPSDNTKVVLVGLPLLLVHDLVRWFAIAAGRQIWALLGDALWVLVMASWLGAHVSPWQPSTPPALLWLLGGLVGAAPMTAILFTRSPAFERQGEPVSAKRLLRLGAPAATENLAGAVGNQLGFYLVVIVIGAEAVGAARGALLLLGPLGILTAGLLQHLLPHMSRAPSHVPRIVLQAQRGVVSAVVLVAIPLFFLPDRAGEALLGATWGGARSALPAMMVYTGFVLCFMVAQAGVRAHRASSKLLRLRRVDAALIPLTLAAGAAIGRQGFFWAVALTGAFDLLMVTSTLRRVATDRCGRLPLTAGTAQRPGSTPS